MLRRDPPSALLIGLLVACGSSGRDRGRPEPGDLDTARSDTDTVLLTDTGTPASPVDLTADATAAVAAFVEFVTAADYALVTETIGRVHAREGTTCPLVTDYPQGRGWFNADCHTPEGDHFFGVLLSIDHGWADHVATGIGEEVLDTWAPRVHPDWADTPAPEPTAAEGHNAIFTVTGTDDVISMTGQYHALEVDWGGIHVSELALGGAVLDPQARAGTWVADGVVPNLRRITVRGPDGRDVVLVRGSVAGLAAAFDTVWADLAFPSAAAGATCADEPEGTLAVRDPDGNWADLWFSGTPCDGCADVVRAGEPLGQLCLSLEELWP